jgi:two-component system cell cycle response regulator CpdR
MAKILVAEDDESLRSFVCHALVRAGHVVQSVDNGQAGLESLQQHAVDILITDIHMPVVDGITLATEAKKIIPNLHVVFITGFSAMITKCRQQVSPHVTLLSKPFHLKELIHEIDQVLATAR